MEGIFVAASSRPKAVQHAATGHTAAEWSQQVLLYLFFLNTGFWV